MIIAPLQVARKLHLPLTSYWRSRTVLPAQVGAVSWVFWDSSSYQHISSGRWGILCWTVPWANGLGRRMRRIKPTAENEDESLAREPQGQQPEASGGGVSWADL